MVRTTFYSQKVLAALKAEKPTTGGGSGLLQASTLIQYMRRTNGRRETVIMFMLGTLPPGFLG